MAKLISILGADGAGKDFWLQKIIQAIPAEGMYPLPCTSYHLSPFCKNTSLSRLLEKIGEKADEVEDAALKAMALFLKMMLFGEELEHLQSSFKAQAVLSTRHPVIDTIVYSRLFIQNVPLGPKVETDHLQRAKALLSPAEWALLLPFLEKAQKQCGASSLEKRILQTSQLPAKQQLDSYCSIFNTPLPAKILFLNPPVDTLLKHLGQREGKMREIHEKRAYLERLSAYFEESLSVVKTAHPEIRIFEVAEASGMEAEILAFIKG